MDNFNTKQEAYRSKLYKERKDKDNDFCSTDSDFCLIDSDFCLKDSDFYPPSDNRTFHMYAGKEFEEYTEYIYDLYEDEGFYEN